MMTDTTLLPTRVLGIGVAAALQRADRAKSTQANIQKVGHAASGARPTRRSRGRCRRSSASRETGPDDAASASSAARSIRRRTPAAARTTSATSRGTCRRSRCAIRRTFPACPATTGRTRIAMATPIAHKGVDRRRQGAGDDAGRPAAEARGRHRGLGLLQRTCRRGTQKYEPLIRPQDTAGDRAEPRHHGEVPRADAEVLLRSDEVQDVPRAARHQYPTIRK